jgi:hypothetical protein
MTDAPARGGFLERRQGQPCRRRRDARTLDLVCALTMFDESGRRSRSHGLRPELDRGAGRRLGLRP